MLDWFCRSRKRQDELANGVDADLVRDNRNRSRISLYLIGFALLLGAAQTKLSLTGIWRSIATALTIVLFVGGALLAQWARAESSFLNKPDPKEPPKLWK
jgi:hypothetical protein